jgi:cytochrome c peroxidase
MFTDGLPRAVGVGVTPRKTMTLVGVAHSNWFFWDGRKDSMWSQALGPTENPVEHAGNRSQFAHIIATDATYRAEYEALFGPLPDVSDPQRFPASAGPVADPAASAAWAAMTVEDQDTINRIFSNMGKAIAAYERLLMPGPTRFDAYIDAVLAGETQQMRQQLTEAEAHGLQLFTGRAQCINCHNGPLLTNHSFHNTGIPPAADLPPDLGRREGVVLVQEDEFNCTGNYSDAAAGQCPHLQFMRTEGLELVAAFKVPTLRNISLMAPYMHSGQIATLPEVLNHYNQAPLAVRGHSEAAPLNLSAEDMQNLEAFLLTLEGPLATAPEFLAAPAMTVTP